MTQKGKKEAALDVNNAMAQSEAFIIKYKKQLLIALVAVAVVVGGGLAYYFGYQQPREEKAQSLLTLGLPYLAQQDYDKALKGDGRFPGFTRLANDYSSTDAGNLANVYAGISYEKTGKIKEAIKYLEQFSPKSDHTISPAGIAALANCYASDKQVDKAVEAFKKAADKDANPALSPLYLLEAGKLLESQKKNDQALEVYQLIKKSYPTSTMATPQRLQNGTFANPEIDRYIERVSK